MKVTIEAETATLAFEMSAKGLSDNDMLWALTSLLRATVAWLTGEEDLDPYLDPATKDEESAP